MAGAAGTGAGLGIMGGILGGIGDIMQATKYKRPTLPQPGGQEARLRQLAQSQLLGGGQELLAGTNLYNQMAPILMSQLPGMHYTPPTSLGGVGGASMGAGGSPAESYSSAVSNFQNQQALQRQMTALKAQIAGTKPGGGVIKGLKQQQKQLQRQIKSLPTAGQLQQQQYQAGTTPDASLYNVGMGSSSPSAGTGLDMSDPNNQQSLAQIQALMGQLGPSGQSSSQPDYLSMYSGAGGY